MLRFRTRPKELAELNLGAPLAAGSNAIYIHDGTLVTGATKVFKTGDSSFDYEGCGMTYYYSHGTRENKQRDSADYIITLWGDYRMCEANILNHDRKFESFRNKYPIFTASIINSLLARTGRHEDIETPFYMMQMHEGVPDYALHVPFDPNVSVSNDIAVCNFDDVNCAHDATQLLLRVSMVIDKEIFADEARFMADIRQLE